MRACSSLRSRARGAPRSVAGPRMARDVSAAKSRPMDSPVAAGQRSGSIPRSSSIRCCHNSVSGSSSVASVATRRCCRAPWSPPPPPRRRARRCRRPMNASARASGRARPGRRTASVGGSGACPRFCPRAEMLTAVQHVLEQVRTALTTDTARTQFDAIFRPGGAWRLDLHGAALDIARLRSRRLQWDDVVPALLATGVIAIPAPSPRCRARWSGCSCSASPIPPRSLACWPLPPAPRPSRRARSAS